MSQNAAGARSFAAGLTLTTDPEIAACRALAAALRPERPLARAELARLALAVGAGDRNLLPPIKNARRHKFVWRDGTQLLTRLSAGEHQLVSAIAQERALTLSALTRLGLNRLATEAGLPAPVEQPTSSRRAKIAGIPYGCATLRRHVEAGRAVA